MLELPKDFPWLHEIFVNQGFHALRKSNRYWAGLWTDLVIEQVMMRYIKSQGGLTRGIGITESVRLQWILSMHKCAGIHEAMTMMTNMKTKANEQHIELADQDASMISRTYSKFKNGLFSMSHLM